MIAPLIPPDEAPRLQSLRRLGLLNTQAEERFDRLTRVASKLFDVPIALITMVDENRQWFKSCIGLTVAETGRDISFCGHTILTNEPFIIPDTLADLRFHDNPLVTGHPHIRFYAGAPLATDDAKMVGTVCIIDTRPRDLTPEQIGLLQDLAAMASAEINSLGHQRLLDLVQANVKELGWKSAFLEAQVNASPDGIVVVDNRNQKILQNQRMIDLLKIPPEIALDPDNARQLEWALSIVKTVPNPETMQRMFSPTHEVHRTEIELHDGTFIDVFSSPVLGPEGVNYGRIFNLRDITETKVGEAELQRLHYEYERILNAVDGGVHWIGMDGRIKFENPAACRMLGYETHELLGRPAHVTMHHTRADGTPYPVDECSIYRTLRDGQARRVEGEVFWRKDGTRFDVAYTSSPIFFMGEQNGVVVTFIDITERNRFEHDLREARLAAESASQSKTDFLANMSHEIRTPLNGIIGMTDLISGTTLSTEQRDFLETIHASSENLLTIVNDVLDFSKIEFGKLELDYHAFSLLDLLDDVVGLLNFRVAKKKLEFNFGIQEGLPVDFLGDATRIRQILVNLVTNAIKFTEHGHVSIDVAAAAPMAEDKPGVHRLFFRVSDTGIGIPADRLDRLFKVFSQVDASTTRRYGGSGLGLAICQKLVETMGGTIGVESTPGVGSTFSFNIPLELAQARDPSASVELLLSGKHVLIVDDNATNRRMLSLQVARWNITWREISDPQQAIDILEGDEHFDAALLDFRMPETDGIMLARRIRQLPHRARLPLVLVSSYTGNDSVEEIKKAGFAAVLGKPVRQNLLRSTLQEVVDPAADQPASPTLSVEPLASLAPLRILVVEDNATNQKVAQSILKRLGCGSDLAGNGLQALEAVQNAAYDLIFMDVHMPEMDGLQATRKIREMTAPAAQPTIIALTADVLKGEREVCLSAGMDDYLTKPVSLNAIRDILQRVSTAKLAGKAKSE